MTFVLSYLVFFFLLKNECSTIHVVAGNTITLIFNVDCYFHVHVSTHVSCTHLLMKLGSYRACRNLLKMY